MQSFFAELKRRGVLKAATAYLVVSWLVLEVGHTLFLIFELPHLGMQIVFVLLALGFPVAWARPGTIGSQRPTTQKNAHMRRGTAARSWPLSLQSSPCW